MKHYFAVAKAKKLKFGAKTVRFISPSVLWGVQVGKIDTYCRSVFPTIMSHSINNVGMLKNRNMTDARR